MCDWGASGTLGVGNWGAGCWRPASSHLSYPAALRIYFCFQFPNFDSLAWQPGLLEQGLAWGAWQASGKARKTHHGHGSHRHGGFLAGLLGGVGKGSRGGDHMAQLGITWDRCPGFLLIL